MSSTVGNKNCVLPAVPHFNGGVLVQSPNVTSPEPAVANVEEAGVITPSGPPAPNAEQVHDIPSEPSLGDMVAVHEIATNQPAVDIASEPAGHTAPEVTADVVSGPTANAASETSVNLVSEPVMELAPEQTPALQSSFSPPTGPAAMRSDELTPPASPLSSPAASRRTSAADHRPAHFATIPCRFFARGYCSRGTDCWYKHASPVADPTAEHEESAENTEGETCAICLDVPKRYGLMTGCDHVFCLTCIRSWRASSRGDPLSPDSDHNEAANALASTSKTCPLCRQRTRYVIPSAVFPSTTDGGVHKARIEAVYLRRLAEIPCKHFVASLEAMRLSQALSHGQHPRNMRGPMCPFGNDCHYKHEMTSRQRYVFTESELSRHRHIYANDRRRRNFRQWNPPVRLGLVATSRWLLSFVESSDNQDDDLDDVDDFDGETEWFDMYGEEEEAYLHDALEDDEF